MKPLNVLVLEDSPLDAELLLAELARGGYDVRAQIHCDSASLRRALHETDFDLVICDYNMPQFDAVSALRIFKEFDRQIPFLVLSGTVGEEKAVDIMRAGAHDYIMKDKMRRLLPAIERELRTATERREQERTQSALSTSERGRAMLLNVLDSSSEPIAVIRADLVFLYLNYAGRKMLGLPADHAIGAHTLTEFLPEWAAQQLKQEMLPLAVTTGTWTGETAVRSTTGREVAVWQVLGCQKDGDGNVDYFFTILRDLTDQKALQASLMFADRMASVGVLAASIAHEINNPLTYLSGYLDRAEAAVSALSTGANGQGREILKDLEHVKDGVTRVKGIAHDLKIFFGKVDAPQREAIRLNDVLESSIKMAAFETRHRATVCRDFQVDAVVSAPESRLGQVFINILLNAAQSIREGDVAGNRITVRTKRGGAGADNEIITEIEDTGVGIPEEKIGRIFDPFFTTKPPGIGTGLGLFVCCDVIRAAGGRIEVESTGGRGTTFRITLKVADPALVTRAPAPAAAEPTRVPLVAGTRVLVIDDEPAIVEFLKCALETESEVTTAAGGDEALEIVRNNGPFDAIVSDVMMRDGTGIKFYEAIKKEFAGQEDRILFMTGGAPTPEARAFLEATANPQIAKPFAVKDLTALIDQVVRRPPRAAL